MVSKKKAKKVKRSGPLKGWALGPEPRKKKVRKSAQRKATVKKSPGKRLIKAMRGLKKTLAVAAFQPDIKHTMDFPFRVNDRDLFRPLREEITAKLKKSGDAIELRGYPGQAYHDLYNRLSSVMFRPDFPKPPKGLKYVRRQGPLKSSGDIGLYCVVLTIVKKNEKVPRGPRAKKAAAE